jgi:ubiquinone/menaquinone biosynthesis C-methylase UbiE
MVQIHAVKRNYDSIAFIYDRLAGLVYGRALRDAQIYLVQTIPANAHVLILGGGTGWILEEIAKVHPGGLVIDYVDASAKMTALAAKRNYRQNQVNFITARVEELEHGVKQYDVVITPFLLDNFTDEMLGEIFPVIDKHLSNNGVWLYADFRNTDVAWQRSMLKIMYVFCMFSLG